MAYPNDVQPGDTGHVAYHNAEKNAIETHKALTTTAHGGIIASTDSRLTNARTPTPHAASHAANGSDPIPGVSSPFTGGPVSSDITWAQATGPVLVDTVTGQQVRLTVANGVLTPIVLGATTGGTGSGGNAATPGIVALVQVDDADSGPGDTFPVFTGSWTTASNVGDRIGADQYTNTAGNVVIPWQAGVDANGVGSKVTIYGSRASHHGIAAVSIDGGVETLVDLYASTRTDGVAVYTSPTLGAGHHTIRWRWTGTKNAASTDTVINFDGADITNAIPRVSGGGGGGGGTVGTGGFVTRNGNKLVLGSDTSYQFVMWNMATSSGTGGFNNAALTANTTCGNAPQVFDEAGLATVLGNMRQDGHQAIRVWAFGNFDLVNIDKVMAACAAHNIRVILCLSDSFGACADSDTGAGGSGAGSGSNPINNNNDFFNGGWQGNYKAHINRIVPRYKDHTELLAWEVMNEPFDATNIIPAYTSITALIRSIDKNHLISSGTQPGWAYGGDGGQRWKDIQSTCDIASMHEYDGARSVGGGDFTTGNHFTSSLSAATAIGRPLMVGEFGLDQPPSGYSGTRVQGLTDKLTAYLGQDGCCGAGYWPLDRTSGNTGIGVSPDKPEFNVLKNFIIRP